VKNKKCETPIDTGQAPFFLKMGILWLCYVNAGGEVGHVSHFLNGPIYLSQ